jgi:hypothetical protein
MQSLEKWCQLAEGKVHVEKTMESMGCRFYCSRIDRSHDAYQVLHSKLSNYKKYFKPIGPAPL